MKARGLLCERWAAIPMRVWREAPVIRKAAAGCLAGLIVTLGAAAAGADTVPQRPSQIAFNARVAPGSVLVVADTPTGDATSSPLCADILVLKTRWAHEMSGQDVAATPDCAGVPSGSRVKVLRKTYAYAVDDPTQEVVPYGNDAHLIVEVLVLSVPAAPEPPGKLVGRRGYMMVDDLEWPAAR